jgi:hypothetical protein
MRRLRARDSRAARTSARRAGDDSRRCARGRPPRRERARSVRRGQAPAGYRAAQNSVSDAVSRGFVKVRVLRIPRADARVELSDGLLVLLPAGISRRQSRDLIDFFATRENLTLELKTKTDEIENLLEVDPRGRVLVSWTLSPDAVYQSSEHLTASPAERIAAARAVLDAGYRVAFHFDPLIAYPEAERDYLLLIDQLLDVVPPKQISFVSMGGLRMTPRLRGAARGRFPGDPMLCGEDVLAADGRFRTFTPLRLSLYRALADRFRKAGAEIPAYLCMEPASVHEHVFGAQPMRPATIGERLARN